MRFVGADNIALIACFPKTPRSYLFPMQAIAIGDTDFTQLRLALEVMFEGVEGAGTLPVEVGRGEG